MNMTQRMHEASKVLRTQNRVVLGEASQSLSSEAYEAIKYKIICCEFEPGTRLNEASLSNILQIGRTPVHEAVTRLMHEGMLEVIPRKGTIVKAIDRDEVMQIVNVRLVNECHCARLAVAHADIAEIANLAAIHAQAKEWANANDIKQMMLLDREFHLCLARMSKNNVLIELLRNLHERSLRLWFISLASTQHHIEVQDEHESILAAIRARNADAADAAIRDHIESFRRNVIQFL